MSKDEINIIIKKKKTGEYETVDGAVRDHREKERDGKKNTTKKYI